MLTINLISYVPVHGATAVHVKCWEQKIIQGRPNQEMCACKGSPWLHQLMQQQARPGLSATVASRASSPQSNAVVWTVPLLSPPAIFLQDNEILVRVPRVLTGAYLKAFSAPPSPRVPRASLTVRRAMTHDEDVFTQRVAINLNECGHRVSISLNERDQRVAIRERTRSASYHTSERTRSPSCDKSERVQLE